MAHRGETLHKDVSCIGDLKRMGSSRLPTMVRGVLSPWINAELQLTGQTITMKERWI